MWKQLENECWGVKNTPDHSLIEKGARTRRDGGANKGGKIVSHLAGKVRIQGAPERAEGTPRYEGIALILMARMFRGELNRVSMGRSRHHAPLAGERFSRNQQQEKSGYQNDYYFSQHRKHPYNTSCFDFQ